MCHISNDIGAPCDDGNACSKNDSCQAGGKCSGVVDLPAEPTNTCYLNVCDPADGIAKPQPVAGSNGMPCDPKNACVNGSICTNGNCSGTAVVCVNPNPAGSATCDKIKGCVFAP